MRCLNMVEAVNHPDRLKYPLKRSRASAARTSWERISWDEAYDIIAREAFAAYRRSTAPNRIMCFMGTGRDIAHRAITPSRTPGVRQSPNVDVRPSRATRAIVPRIAIMRVHVVGALTVVDCLAVPPEALRRPALHGARVLHRRGATSPSDIATPTVFYGHWIADLHEARHRRSPWSTRSSRGSRPAPAEDWLQRAPRRRRRAGHGHAATSSCGEDALRPATSATSGCYGLGSRVRARGRDGAWTMAVREVTWVPEEDVQREARTYSPRAKPAAIQWGVALDQQTVSGQPGRARLITALWRHHRQPRRARRQRHGRRVLGHRAARTGPAPGAGTSS